MITLKRKFMFKVKVVLAIAFAVSIVSASSAYKLRTLDYVWMAHPLYPERGCTMKVNNYTLDPNSSFVMITFASVVNTTTCDMKSVYVGE